jgi:hypothetical protein
MNETETREAPSPSSTTFKKDDVLRLIVAQEIKPLFLRPHLDQRYLWAFLCGFIGDRGAGKSGSCAVVSLVDRMVSGQKVFSNMKIKTDILVDDDIAAKYGLKSGGAVHYESEDLDKDALLDLDEKYRRSCLVIEEINVEYSNVRRAMSNTNVDFNQVAQQLRHFETSLIYNVINEMFIDPQLRSLTDVFVKTSDTAFDIDALNAKKPRGLDFKWEIIPTSAYLRGEQGKNKRLPPAYFHFADWQGCYDDMINQTKGIYSVSTKDKNKKFLAKVSTESSGEMTEHFTQWQWLVDMIQSWKKDGVRFLTRKEIIRMIGRPLTDSVRRELPVWGVTWDNEMQGWVLDDYILPETPASTGG